MGFSDKNENPFLLVFYFRHRTTTNCGFGLDKTLKMV